MLCISDTFSVRLRTALHVFLILTLLAVFGAGLASAQETIDEANLKLPDLGTATFLGDINGRTLLIGGLGVSALGLIFGLMIFVRLKKMPVHQSMLEVSELIYETCKT